MTETEPALRIEVRNEPPGVVLVADGEIDLHTAPLLSEHVERAAAGGATQIAIDCDRVGFLDSAGLRALVLAHDQLRQGDVRLTITRPSSVVARVLEITSLDESLISEEER